ncbi:uncharacterized protein V6R79_001279 [Siganus canaliculatus]
MVTVDAERSAPLRACVRLSEPGCHRSGHRHSCIKGSEACSEVLRQAACRPLIAGGPGRRQFLAPKAAAVPCGRCKLESLLESSCRPRAKTAKLWSPNSFIHRSRGERLGEGGRRTRTEPGRRPRTENQDGARTETQDGARTKTQDGARTETQDGARTKTQDEDPGRRPRTENQDEDRTNPGRRPSQDKSRTETQNKPRTAKLRKK